MDEQLTETLKAIAAGIEKAQSAALKRELLKAADHVIRARQQLASMAAKKGGQACR